MCLQVQYNTTPIQCIISVHAHTCVHVAYRSSSMHLCAEVAQLILLNLSFLVWRSAVFSNTYTKQSKITLYGCELILELSMQVLPILKSLLFLVKALAAQLLKNLSHNGEWSKYSTGKNYFVVRIAYSQNI